MPWADNSLFKKPALSIEAKAEQTSLLRLVIKQAPANLTFSAMIIYLLFLFCLFIFFNSNLWEQSHLICRSKWCIKHRFRRWCIPTKSKLHKVSYSHGYRGGDSTLYNSHDLQVILRSISSTRDGDINHTDKLKCSV